MSKFSPTQGEPIRSANSRYCSKVSIIKPGSGSISKNTSNCSANATQGMISS